VAVKIISSSDQARYYRDNDHRPTKIAQQLSSLKRRKTTDIGVLAEAVVQRLTAHQGDFYRSGVWLALLQLLMQGQPVATAQIAQAVGQSPREVARVLAGCVDLKVDGHHIVGRGLSLNRTPHQFRLSGHTLYTWCAPDTLMYVAALGQTAEIRSTCPVTQNEIRFKLTSDTLTDLTPATAVISVVIPAGADICCRDNLCNQGHFFSTAEAASRWLGNQPGAYVLSVKG
jgi:alkylmercury lyase